MSKRIINWFTLGILFWVTIISCQQTTITNVATADVFIKSIVNQGDTLFGVAHSVFSYNRMISVSVINPDGDSIPLPGIADKGISIYKDPSLTSGDFVSTLPLAGVYKYDVTFKDKTQQTFSNTLGTDYILPAEIDTLDLSQDGQSVNLKWNPVPGAQSYQIRVTKGNTEIIPAKLYSSSDGLEIQFPVSSFTNYLPGTFTIELDALLFETSGSSLLQAMSIAYGSISLQ